MEDSKIIFHALQREIRDGILVGKGLTIVNRDTPVQRPPDTSNIHGEYDSGSSENFPNWNREQENRCLPEDVLKEVP